MALSKMEVDRIAQATIGQRENPLWHKMREKRLTASCFGRALRAVDKPARLDAFRNELFAHRDISGIPAIKWGTAHETVAVTAYEKLTGYTVKETGLWLLPNGLLGASPDGLVYEGDRLIGILEIKCPFSMRWIKDPTDNDFRRCLPYYGTTLKETHDYYHQVQGELAATGAPWCDFFIWTPHGSRTIRVLPNDKWCREKLSQLSHFYAKKVLREEDRAQIYHYELVVEQPMEVDPCPKTISLHNLYVDVFTIHLARWITLFNKATNYEWPKACDVYFTQALSHTCENCVKALLSTRISDPILIPNRVNHWLAYPAHSAHVRSGLLLATDPTIAHSPCTCCTSSSL